MTIRSSLLALALSVSMLSAPGAPAPALAASHPGAAPEYGALPPLRDDVGQLALPVERSSEEGGSAADRRDDGAGGDGDPGWAAEADPWAEAVAESLQVCCRATVVGPPPYPVDVNAQVQFFLDRFTGSRRDVVDLWLSRAGTYLGMVRQVLRRHGLPEELAFVPLVESGFNPRAVSRAGAKGLWQFMAGTARRYGLRVDQWVDERFDPEKSTLAAAAHLRDLHQQFGSWALAQAAYNAGELAVSRAIRGVRSTDFWALAGSRFLRRETKEFVPQIQAAVLIGRDPERYGFEVQDATPPPVETVVVPPATRLRTLAARAGLSEDTLRALNPALLRGVTPPGALYEIRVPGGSRPTVLAAVAPGKAVAAAPRGGAGSPGPDFHVVRPRDTVAAIAKRYRVSVENVVRWNSLEPDHPIRPGDRLRVAEARLPAAASGQGAR